MEVFTSRPGNFTPEKECRYIMNKKLGGPKSRYGSFREGKRSPLACTGSGNPDRPAFNNY
jgi:hypothetical protein